MPEGAMQMIAAAAAFASPGTWTGAPLASSQSQATRMTVAAGSGSVTGGVRTESWACGPVTGASWGPRLQGLVG